MRGVLVCALLAAPACIGTSPEERARAALGEADDGDEEHRPGQPCLTCHGPDYSPGGDVFALAGTVYLYASDPDGLEGADIEMTDAEGRAFTARSNRVGNFMVEVDGDVAAPERRERGRLAVPWQPAFPIRIAVRHGDVEQIMETVAWREGSCAACHTAEPGASSVGRVYLLEEDAP